VVDDHLGLSYDRPVAFLHDYLSILRPLLTEHAVDHRGERLRTRLRLDLAPSAAEAPPVLLAALGPRMLELAGRVADGVMTWMAGIVTLGQHIVPGVTRAAGHVGRPPPRVLASLPTLLTHDRAAGVAQANREFAVYGRLPAYRAMLDHEGAATGAVGPVGPGDIALVGDERQLTTAIGRLRDAGVTDFQATPFGDAPAIARTLEFLAGRPGG
jgi:alkanesulfonate monooxygenase SsuD/methylene tetrahydromethanopterin reductase-like flavin-dependent oxidoreductase (luciferase family)